MGEESLHRSGASAKGDEQEPRAKSEILQEIPKQRPALAGIRAPKVARLPELFPEQCGNAAIPGQDEGTGAIRDPGNNPKRHKYFYEQSDENQPDRNGRIGRRLARLGDGAAEVNDF